MLRGTLSRVSLMDWALALVLNILILWLGYFVPRSAFGALAFGLTFSFAIYFWVLFYRSEVWPFYLMAGMLARVVLLFSIPALSDDVYRFIWDGRLWVAGENPFTALPEVYADRGFDVPGLDRELYAKLNSAAYFTIYPPVPQCTFWLSAWISPGSIFGAVLVQRICILFAEAGTVLYVLPQALKAWGKSPAQNLIYAANPMIILEITGNLHHEGFVVFFLLLSWLGLRQKKWLGSAAAMAGAICSKLLPLMFLPFIWRRAGPKSGALFYLLTGMLVFLAFVPLYDPSFFYGFRESLDLYFRRFEFNASIFYLLRWIGFQQQGYDIIQTAGPNLAKLVFVAIVALAALERRPRWGNLPLLCLIAITIYLLGATTVHPWYVTLPLVCCMFTNFRFPLVWSFLIMGTYINYSYPEYQENLWIVGVEYTLVIGLMLVEIIRQYRGQPSWVMASGRSTT